MEKFWPQQLSTRARRGIQRLWIQRERSKLITLNTLSKLTIHHRIVLLCRKSLRITSPFHGLLLL
jgi:hypothetical protein